MAWDDRDGLDSMRHFHSCWRIVTLRKLYKPRLPCFLSNDLDSTDNCFPPTVAVKKGQHRVVRMERSAHGRKTSNLVEDEYVNEKGNLFQRYPIEDNTLLATPMVGAPTEARQ